jgi:hypothetical protein
VNAEPGVLDTPLDETAPPQGTADALDDLLDAVYRPQYGAAEVRRITLLRRG